MRRWLAALGALVVLAGAAALGLWLWNRSETADVRGSPTVEFVATDEPGASAPATEPAATAPEPAEPGEVWPTYGFDPARTRYAAGIDLRPPFRRLWMVRGRSLLEFPPVVAYGRLYVGTNRGRFLAIDGESGEIAWERDFGRCIAASPAVGDGVVYVALMDPSPCAQHDAEAGGFIVALDAETGRPLWRFRAGVVESSPLLVDGVLYFGAWDRLVYALDVRTRKPRWTFETDDRVKGGAAYARGTVYVGSYDGRVYALDARTGALRWSAEAQGGLAGAGNFYATPAVAYGRVFIGNTDGKVYAFGARSGDLLWAQSTGGYVYSSAAVWERTVYAGSYDGRLYAFDAATGEPRWSFAAGGPISGSPTVMAGAVYVSTLAERTYALDARTGEQLWTFPDGKYTPLVADGERAYLTGYTRVYGLAPRG